MVNVEASQAGPSSGHSGVFVHWKSTWQFQHTMSDAPTCMNPSGMCELQKAEVHDTHAYVPPLHARRRELAPLNMQHAC
jgi:hypothetical protein